MMTPTFTREEFLAMMAIEATKMERLARQIREGQWETYDIEETIDRDGQDVGKEKATIMVRVSRLQDRGTGLDITIDEEPGG